MTHHSASETAAKTARIVAAGAVVAVAAWGMYSFLTRAGMGPTGASAFTFVGTLIVGLIALLGALGPHD